MFYSQFILAKKGTLGTIWIAAHLERKLRKNQVADTDIGDSVDSILFPDVPIALRLSSHLLLGVVRIYSRKVNYLFDDCSEALLKVKQAFRSTAVDLPPEESTAPYHSITLPETFDLEDFELPDSDILQGNYVDHHVSTREQITLQDTMEGMVYSTSQFGLDERFGDGETYGFDLDEEIFLTKVAASRHAGDMLASGAEPHVPVQLTSPLELNENHDEINGNPKAMVVPDRLDGLAGSTDYIEYAQAPCTPGLVEEPNLSKTQEASAYDDQLELVEQPNFSNIQEASASDYNLESEVHNITNFAAKENMPIITSNPDIQLKSRVDSPPTAGNSVLAESVRFTSPGFESSYRNYTAFDSVNNGLPDLQNGIDMNNEPESCCIDGANVDIVERVNLEGTSCPSFSNEVHAGEDFSRALFSGIENNCAKSLSSTCEPVSDYVSQSNQVAVAPEIPNNVVNAGNMENQWPTSNSVASNVEFPGRENLEIPEKSQACQELLSSNVDEKLTAAKIHVLQPCKNPNELSMLNYGCDVSAGPLLPSGVLGLCSEEISGGKEAPHVAEASTDFQGEWCNAPDFMEHHFNENKIMEPASSAEIQMDNSKCNIVDIILGKNRIKNIAGFENFELPAPERLLCVPERLVDPQENVMDSTPYLLSGGGGDFGININSGKKRSITESTLTMHSLNSDEYLVGARSKRMKEYIPESDDLLASILVGRSPVLKIVPTPVPQPRITRMKFQESAPRSALKRKVLMDDAMILHGDVIRQQLTSTEDIRRTRKKAPCTRPEIWMIQKEFLEDEIFSEPVFTGYSGRLALLHSRTHDLRKIRISQNDTYNPLLEDATKQNAGLLKDETNALKAANNMIFSVGPNVHHNTEMEWTNESLVGGNHVKASHPGNLQDEDRVLQFPGNETPLQMNAICDVRVPENVNFGIESASSPNFGLGNHFVRIDASGVQDVQSVALESSMAYISSGKGVNAPVVEKNNVSAAVCGAAEARVRDELLDQIEVGFGSSIDMQTTQEANPSLQISPETNFPSGQVVATFGTVEENDDSAAVGGASEARVRDELLDQNEVGFESSIDRQTTQEAHPSLEISPETNFPSGEIVATFGTVEQNEDTAAVGGEAEVRVRAELLEQTEVGFGSSIGMQITLEANPSLEISSETNFPSGQVIATFGTVEENVDSAAVGGAAEARVRDELLEQAEVVFGSSIREENPSLEISPETNFPSGQVVATFGTMEEHDDSAAVGGAVEERLRDELVEQTGVGFGSSIDMQQTTREANPSLEISLETNFPSGQVVATFGTMEKHDDCAAVDGAVEERLRDEFLEQTGVGFGSGIDMQKTTGEANPSLEISPEINFPSGRVVATFGSMEENDVSAAAVGATEARVRDELLEQTEVVFGSSIDVKTTLEENPSLEIYSETNFPSDQVVATFGTREENVDFAAVCGAAEARVRDELLEQTEVGFGISIDMQQTTLEANRSLQISPETNFPIGQVVATFGTMEENNYSAAVGGAAEARVSDEVLVQAEVGIIDVKTTIEANLSLEISPETKFPSDQVVAAFGTAEETNNHEQGMLLNGEEVLAPEWAHDMVKNLTSYSSIEELKTASHCTMEEPISVADHTATVDCIDAKFKADLHDTGFLNADDDDVARAEEHRRSAEQSNFLENSGWSSRTRAVAKYLKVLFEKEVEHERMVVSMDNLLAGKTRKEASRMFFEALVLKTRDYIHVDQETPFEDIKLKPRVMLMKY